MPKGGNLEVVLHEAARESGELVFLLCVELGVDDRPGLFGLLPDAENGEGVGRAG